VKTVLSHLSVFERITLVPKAAHGSGINAGRLSGTQRRGCGLACTCKSGFGRDIGTDGKAREKGKEKGFFFEGTSVLLTLADENSCCALPSGGFGAFSGIITKGFGFSSFEAILMQIPTGAIGILTLLITIWVTNKIQLRFPVIA